MTAVTTTTVCDPGSKRIGSLVVVPADSDDAALAVKVVGAVGGQLEPCLTEPYPAHCIVTRRALRFLPQTPLLLPIVLRGGCAGVRCSHDHTCVQGHCVSASVEPELCSDVDGCGEGQLLAKATSGWAQRFGGSGDELPTAFGHLGQDLAVTGTFTSPVLPLGGVPLVRAGVVDRFVGLLAPTGAALWATSFAASELLDPAAAAGSSSNMTLTSNVIDGQGEPSGDAHIVFMDSAGNLTGSLRWQATGWVSAEHVSGLDGQLSAYAGRFVGSLDVGLPGIISSTDGSIDGFVVVIDRTTLAISKLYHLASPADVRLGDLGSAAGRAVLVGDFATSLTVGADVALDTTASRAGFVLSLDASSASALELEGSQASNSIQLDALVFDAAARGHIAGRADGELSYAGESLHDGGPRAFVLVLPGPEEGPENAKSKAFPASLLRLTDLGLDGSGNLYAAGLYDGAFDLGADALPAPVGQDDPLVFSLDGKLEHRWSRTQSSLAPASPLELDVIAVDDVVVSGTFEGDLTVGNTTLVNAGGKDVFLIEQLAPLP